jgi:hypothetical protein
MSTTSVFSVPSITNVDRIQELASRFPALRGFPHIEQWDAIALGKAARKASHGEKLAIQFVLGVWNQFHDYGCGRFNAVEAYGTWDNKNWSAFQSWVREPFTL